MNITLRMIAFVFIFLLSVSAAACTVKQEEETTQTTAETEINTPVYNLYADELPAIDGEGDTVNICGWGYAEAAEELYTEELTGEIVNDAVFNRNLAVEQRLNIKMNIVLKMDGGDQYFVPNTVRTAVLAGDGAYDIMAGPTYSSAYFATENIFYDLRSLDYLDLDKSYWAQGYNEVMSVVGAQYICTGTPAISLYRWTVLLFIQTSWAEHLSTCVI